MAVVVSKQPLDYIAMNTAINNSKSTSFIGKLNEAIGEAAIKNVQYTNSGNGSIYFKAGAHEQRNVVGCVVEIEKK